MERDVGHSGTPSLLKVPIFLMSATFAMTMDAVSTTTDALSSISFG